MTIVTVGYILLFALIGSAAYAGLSAAPWVPTKRKDRTPILNRVKVADNQTVYDLGCGTGTMLFDLARRYPNGKYIGYEISLIPLFYGIIRKYLSPKKYKNVHLKFGNLFKKSYKDGDVIIIFLMKKAYEKLLPILEDVPADALIVVEAWGFDDIVPKDMVTENQSLPFFVYEGCQLHKNRVNNIKSPH